MDMDTEMGERVERIRLVVFGGPKVGKSSIVKRFLFNTFDEKYEATVDEIYTNHQYKVGGVTFHVDILDTAGNYQFPAMRRLSIATAHAFLLVYAIDDAESFDQVKVALNDIKQEREDCAKIPIVIAGNKTDVELTNVEVEFGDVFDRIGDQFQNLRTKVVECSAKQGSNVKQVFRCFLDMSPQMQRLQGKDSNDEIRVTSCGFGRRLSVHGLSMKSHHSNTSSNEQLFTQISPDTNGSNFKPLKSPVSPASLSSQFACLEIEVNNRFGRPRSQSLIRRTSKKAKKPGPGKSDECGDCQIV